MGLSEERGGTGAPGETPLPGKAARRKGDPTRMLQLLWLPAGPGSGTCSEDALTSCPTCWAWLVRGVSPSGWSSCPSFSPCPTRQSYEPWECPPNHAQKRTTWTPKIPGLQNRWSWRYCRHYPSSIRLGCFRTLQSVCPSAQVPED